MHKKVKTQGIYHRRGLIQRIEVLFIKHLTTEKPYTTCVEMQCAQFPTSTEHLSLQINWCQIYSEKILQELNLKQFKSPKPTLVKYMKHPSHNLKATCICSCMNTGTTLIHTQPYIS